MSQPANKEMEAEDSEHNGQQNQDFPGSVRATQQVSLRGSVKTIRRTCSTREDPEDRNKKVGACFHDNEVGVDVKAVYHATLDLREPLVDAPLEDTVGGVLCTWH